MILRLYQTITQHKVATVLATLLTSVGITAAIFGGAIAYLEQTYTNNVNYIPYDTDENIFPSSSGTIPFANVKYCYDLAKAWANASKMEITEPYSSYLVLKHGSDYFTFSCMRYDNETSAFSTISTKYNKPDNHGRDLADRLLDSFMAFANGQVDTDHMWDRPSGLTLRPRVDLYSYVFELTVDPEQTRLMHGLNSFPPNFANYLQNVGFSMDNCSERVCSFYKPGVELFFSLVLKPTQPKVSHIPPIKPLSTKPAAVRPTEIEPDDNSTSMNGSVFARVSPYAGGSMQQVLDLVRQAPGVNAATPDP